MKIKDGVIMQGLQLPMRQALIHANQVYTDHDRELVITSALDGTHSAGSYHYYGYAVDLRTRFFGSWREKLNIAQKIRDRLNTVSNKYTVVLEDTHIHIQYNA